MVLSLALAAQNIWDDPNPLPKEVVQALDAGWEIVRGISGRYWH